MSRIYLAGRYGRRPELGQVRRALEAFGYLVTSRWLDGHPDGDGNDERWAREDLEDIDAAGILVCYAERPGQRGRARGGRHVELGYALGTGKRVILVGPRENVFHHLARVTVVENTAQLLRLLAPTPHETWPFPLVNP
jgi:hypothetical protein